MRRWFQLAARLYPARWRERYGPEFEALLEDNQPSAAALWDTLRGALEMQMRMGNMPKIAFTTALAGALIAGVVSWPRDYRAKGAIRVELAPGETDVQFDEQWRDAESEALSRGALAMKIQSMDLYRSQRARRPLADVVDDMRHQIDIRPILSNGRLESFEVSYAYPTPRPPRW